MSIVGKLLGEAGAGAAKGLLDGIGGLATTIRSVITGELPPDLRFKLEELAIQADSLAQKGQMDINLAEAKSTSIFVAGWRPFIGWVCGVAIAWSFVVHPMVVWGMAVWLPEQQLPPTLDLSELYPVVIAMLGLGVYRTYEKAKGVQRDH
jgi:hypothetical protein